MADPYEPPMCSSLQKPTHIPIEEAEKLEAIIVGLRKENEELQLNLYHVMNDKNNLKRKLGRKGT